MNESRRKMIQGLGLGLIGTGLMESELMASEAKPVTKAGLARSLLTLADKAEKAGLKTEAHVILGAALKVIDSPVASKSSRDNF